MIEENWIVYFEDPIGEFGKTMHVFRRADKGTEIVVFPKNTTITKKEGGVVPQGLHLSEGMFSALVDAVHKDFKPSEGKFTEGKLEAQGKHLEDLRKLLKL